MTQRKIQSVQLSDSGVVPGPYTNANVTVDSAGRVTAIANGSSGTPALTNTQVAYGSLSNLITSTPDFTYDDGTGTLSVGPVGFDALIEANIGQSIVVSGDTGARFESNLNTFGINSSGAVLVNASAGTAGQVLTSAGSGAASTWTTPGGGGASAPLNEIVYGTGPGIASDPNFGYDPFNGTLFVNGSTGSNGQVLTSQGFGSPTIWGPAPGLLMNVFLLNNGSGSFDGSLIGNWSSVQQRDENATITWSPDPYGAAFTCQVIGVYEIVVECRIIGDDGSSRWPDDLSAYGVDLLADSPAQNTTPRTKLHTRYSTAGLSTGNLGLQVGPASPVNEAANTSSFTERYIVRSDTGGIVYPRLFAYSYGSTGASASFSMSISFMKISDYSPA